MDKKQKYIVLDTETCNGYMKKTKKGTEELCLDDSLVYDVGWAVVDNTGKVYRTRSFVVNEIFYGEASLMKSAYFAEKLPQYYEQLKTGERTALDLYYIRKFLLADMKEFNIHAIMAHNAKFDYDALNTTERYVTKSKYRYFLPYGTEVWDTMKMATDTICQQKKYKKFCKTNGYMTKPPRSRVKRSAEVLYRYIKHDITFEEKHTGLEDVLIEKEIFVKCTATHRKMRRKLFDEK